MDSHMITACPRQGSDPGLQAPASGVRAPAVTITVVGQCQATCGLNDRVGREPGPESGCHYGARNARPRYLGLFGSGIHGLKTIMSGNSPGPRQQFFEFEMPAAVAGTTTTLVLQSLDECQKSFAAHRKCVIKLKKAQKSDPKEFRVAMLSALDKALLVFKREPCVERLFQFITDFVSFSNEVYHADSELAVDFVRHLVPLTRARDKAVRFRACQLTSKLLNRWILLLSILFFLSFL